LGLNESGESVPESAGSKLLTQFQLAIFLCELARRDLPSLNPLDLYLISYRDFSAKHRTAHRVARIIWLGGGIAMLCTIGLLVFLSQFQPRPITELGERGWLLFYSMMTAMGIAYVGLFILPLGYLFIKVFERIQLTVFTDYIKKDILRDLFILRNYYTLLRNSRVTQKEESVLDKQISEIHEIEGKIQRPRFLRNLTLGSLSSILGLSGLIMTAITGSGFPPLSFLVSLTTISAQMAQQGPSSIYTIAIMVPLYAFLVLVVLPVAYGVRAAVRYSERNFTESRETARSSMLSEISRMSHSGRDVFDFGLTSTFSPRTKKEDR